MTNMGKITDVHAREILDSRGNPTVEAEVTVNGLFTGRASVPSGASTGRFEAVEKRDGEKRYFGLGVHKAVENVNTVIKEALLGEDVYDQAHIDHLLGHLDGTDNKANLGANATLAVSMACARAGAESLGIPLYRYIGGSSADVMPVPMMNILNGGVHADNTVDFQEFMIMPVLAENFTEALRIGVEIYQKLKQLCKEQGLSTAVGDEGGFAPDVKDTFAVLQLIVDAIQNAGYEPGIDVVIAMDAASSELYEADKNVYYFPGESKASGEKMYRDTNEMISYYEMLIDHFPIVSIEDALQESDFEGWQLLTERLGKKVQLVGDDLFVTNKLRLEAGIKLHAGNAILVKLNQIGTVTEATEAVMLAKKSGFNTIISHRSGETEDSFIADFAVGLNAGQIKTGAPCRSDRNAKYNQLLRIEECLKGCGKYSTPFQPIKGYEK